MASLRRRGVVHIVKTAEVNAARRPAKMVVFRDISGKHEQHHFEVASDGQVRVWNTWRSKGILLMEGSLEPADRIELNVRGGGRIRLSRLSPPIAR